LHSHHDRLKVCCRSPLASSPIGIRDRCRPGFCLG